jgi:hypothetical protein
MIIDDGTVDLAVLEVFFEFQIPPGGRLAWASLCAEWPKAGLRATDLHQGVLRLVEQDALRWQSEGDNRFLALTELGHRRGHPPASWERPLRQLWRGLTARRWPRNRRSRREDLAAQSRRRVGDTARSGLP